MGLDQGWLVVFDVRLGRSWGDRLWERSATTGGKRVIVLGA